MKIFLIDPVYVIPWEHDSFYLGLKERAVEEKLINLPFDKRIANARASLEELQQLGLLEYEKKYVDTAAYEGWKHVPPVPVIAAPDDLLHLGFFIVYNGHHRLESARRAELPLPVMLIQDDSDIRFLNKHHEDLFSMSDEFSFQYHREHILNYAYSYIERLI